MEPRSQNDNSSKSPLSSNIPSFIAAMGMCVAFLLPWVDIMGFSVPGILLVFGMMGSGGGAAGIILALSGACAVTHFTTPLKPLNIVAGIAPFVMLSFSAIMMGSELFHVLGIGAWVTLGCGLVLIVAPVKPTNTNAK